MLKNPIVFLVRSILVFVLSLFSFSVFSMDVKTLSTSTDLAVDYLINNCDSDGKFVYKRNESLPIDKEDYNLLRHAGSIYSLCYYYDHNNKNRRKVKRTILASANYLLTYIKKVENEKMLFAVWSCKEPNVAKLGGTGLGLIALCYAQKLFGPVTKIEILDGMGDFLLFMQDSSGRFSSKYDVLKGGQQTKWESLYYPGEAALGLIFLYDISPQQKWLDSSTKTLLYLYNKRLGKSEVEADHWALLATAALISKHVVSSRDDEMIRSHAIQIVKSILFTKAKNVDAIRNGGFTRDGRTCPTATRLEGLAAYYPFVEDNKLKLLVYQTMEDGIDFLMRSQNKKGELRGGIPRAITEIDNASKSFNKRVGEVRIDYVQHALSALISYKILLADSK